MLLVVLFVCVCARVWVVVAAFVCVAGGAAAAASCWLKFARCPCFPTTKK